MRWAHRGVWCSKIQHLMEAELFAAIVRTPCTVWPRTVMRGKSRKVNSGHNSVPKPARRTEPSPRNPRFAAHLRCVSAKEGLGKSRGDRKPLVSCPLLSPPPDGGTPGRRRRPLTTPSEGVKSPPAAHRCIGGRSAVRRRYRDKKPAAAWESCRGRYCSAVRAHTHFYGERGRTALRTGNS